MTAPQPTYRTTANRLEVDLCDETGRILAEGGWEIEELHECADDIVEMIRSGNFDNYSDSSRVAKMWRDAGCCPEDFYSFIEDICAWMGAWKDPRRVGRAIL